MCMDSGELYPAPVGTDRNDQEYNRIISSINLEEVRRIAMGELGMVYAEEGQIITYEGNRSDYMRKVTGKGK